MSKVIVSLLLFVASAMAKGRSGGSRGSGDGIDIDDNWDAPGETKAAFAFEIIWFVGSLTQLTAILKNLKGIPSMAARGPYILLAVVTIFLALYYLLTAILTRADGLASSDENALLSAANFFGDTDGTFRPVVVLYLLHVRGDVLRALKGNMASPLSTQIWKRILDWVLTALAWVMFTASVGVSATQLAEFANGDYDNLEQLYQASLGLSQTGLAFLILLIIILVVSVIVQFIQGKGIPTADLVTSRLLFLAVPLFVLYAAELLFFDIFSLVGPSDYDTLAFNLASVIVNGVVELSITAVMIHTMTLPGIQWTPQTIAPEAAGIPGKPWGTPNSGWSQPYPPSAGWNQPGYNPQQHPQQPPTFYPQPHPMFQQQQQYPYSSPTQPMPNQNFQYFPPTQPVPNQPAQT